VLITGSLTVTGSSVFSGSVTSTLGFTGSLSGSALAATSASYASTVAGGTTSYIPLWTGNTTLGSSVIYQSGSNIGIGVSPQLGFKLDVNGWVVFRNTNLYLDGTIIGFGTNGNYQIADAGNSWIAGATGNVGIGTKSPNSKLDVNGNTTVTGSLNVTSGITGSLSGSATTATSASYAATSSYADNFTVGNTLTAQRIVVQTISSSISYASGSNRFGSLLTDTHQFTGSVGITGSLNVIGSATATTLTDGYITINAANINRSGNTVEIQGQSGGNVRLFGAGSIPIVFNASTGNVQIGTTSADNGAKLQISGSVTAASALARGATITPTLVASANSDVLVGLDVNPTFTTGAFTGVSSLSARFTGNVLMGQVPSSLAAYSYVPLTLSNNAGGALRTQLSLVNSGGGGGAGSAIDFFTYTSEGNGNPGLRITGVDDGVYSGNFQILTKAQGSGGNGALTNKFQIFGGTGNVVIQNGGIFTDAGYKLDVNGTARISGNTTVTGSVISTVGFTGSLSGSATNAISASFAVTASNANTASFVQTAQTASYVLNAVSASFAATASSADNFTVRGTLTAQTINVQTITSSIEFNTGSTRHGSLLTDTHQFTGSVGITGSLSTNGDQTLSGSLNIVPTSGNKGIVITVNAGNTGFIQQGSAGGNTFTIDGANGGGPRLGLGDSPSAGYNYFQIGAFNSENNFDTVGRNFSIRSTISATNDTRFKLFYNTGNVLIQNGGTFTDAGFRLDVSGSTRLNGAVTVASASIQSQNTSSLASGTQTISTNATASFTAAFYNYTIASGSNTRAGQFIATWNGGSIQYMDNSTVDIGSTLPVALTASLSGANILLTSTLPSSGWTIKTLVNLI
jgi:hypothetical protein